MREVAPLTLHACAAASGVFARVGLLWGFGMLVRFVRGVRGWSRAVVYLVGEIVGVRGWSGLFGFVRGVLGGSRAVVYLVGEIVGVRGWSGLFGFVRGVLGGSRAVVYLVGEVVVVRDVLGGSRAVVYLVGEVVVVRDVRGGSMWLEVSIGRSLVLLWKSDGITTWAGWGIGTAAVDGAASRGGCERVLACKLGPLRCGRCWVWVPRSSLGRWRGGWRVLEAG